MLFSPKRGESGQSILAWVAILFLVAVVLVGLIVAVAAMTGGFKPLPPGHDLFIDHGGL